MKIIAVDPGYDRLGVAVMDNASGRDELLFSTCLTTKKTLSIAERIHQLGNEFATLLTTYTPDALSIETLFFTNNQKTAIAVAETRGVLIYLASVAGCTIYEHHPQEIKVATTGYGKSDKTAVIAMVKRLVPNCPPTALDDEYDAIAVAITGLAIHGRTQ